jgi:hypothetical protein
MRMPDDRPFTLDQADQARVDLAGIHDEFQAARAYLARLWKRKDLARIIFCAAVFLLLGTETLFW